jgi:large subunit ribosomal protein L15
VNLDQVNQSVAGHPYRHRIGRGPASGWGTTAGRGNNGARCRSGWKSMLHREGGQMPIIRRIPKRGFNNKDFGNVWSFVNLHALNAFNDGDVVTPEELLRRGLIPKIKSGVKVLGVGADEFARKLTLKVHRVSAAAKAVIEAKGGTIELIQIPGDNARKDWKAKRGKGKATTRRVEAKARADKKKPAAPKKK